MGPDSRDQIMAVLKAKGPLVPNDLKKIIKGDTMIFGAILSELSSRGMVKIADLKKGGSPLYYLPGQEAQLENFVEFLNPKDQTTVQFLKTQKVVFDRNLELFQRVSVRKIKDYAKEMKVSTSDGEMLFWRYYLVSEHDALEILKERYNKPKTPVQEEVKEAITETLQEEKEQVTEELNEEKKSIDKIKEENSSVVEEEQKELNHPNIRKPVSIPKPLQTEKNSSVSQQQLTTSPGLQRTPFYDSVWKFFEEQNINVLEESMVAKDKEYEFVITVPSAIGTINYYCRARNKKKLNEGDVAPALLKAKQKDLQCLFLTNGEFTKKSLVMMKKEYQGLIIKTF
ncbi:hypothetical protein JXA48_00965 [Candidatus Woesearchaeota archaeon]|nr:hypothetical protein [Candidatus Woesearchaeota archaeon]